jgi:methyl-accepting chemotaxis protein
MILTLRRSLVLVALAAAAALIATLLWVTATYQQFAIATLNQASGATVAFMVQQRADRQYLERLTPIVDQWARASVLVDAVSAGDRRRAALAANSFFTSMEVDSGQVRLRNVVLYTPDMEPLGAAENRSGEAITQRADIVAALRARDIAARRTKAAYLWRSEAGRPVHSIIAPIGGFRVAGFVEFVTDPLPNLAGIGAVVGGTVRVHDATDAVVFEDAPPAAAAPAGEAETDPVVETLSASVTGSDRPWARVSVTRDIGPFVATVNGLRNQALVIFAAVLAASLACGWLLLQLAVFRKLAAFATAARRH